MKNLIKVVLTVGVLIGLVFDGGFEDRAEELNSGGKPSDSSGGPTLPGGN